MLWALDTEGVSILDSNVWKKKIWGGHSCFFLELTSGFLVRRKMVEILYSCVGIFKITVVEEKPEGGIIVFFRQEDSSAFSEYGSRFVNKMCSCKFITRSRHGLRKKMVGRGNFR
ncbi:hypothetical protein ABFS83_14G081100 [Erythranthe nasuta]